MKNFIIVASIICGILVFIHEAPAQAQRQGCKVIDAHCVCQNPSRDFKVENHKWGKTNRLAGEGGDCRGTLDIDEALKRAPVVFCMSGQQTNKDPRLPQTQCQVTWTCKEACTY